MRLIKIGLSNIDTAVGALKTNTDKILEHMEDMASQKCTIGCFCEQTIVGYPTEDLVQWKSFVQKQRKQLNRVLEKSLKIKFMTAFVLGLIVENDGNLYNCAAVICNGRIIGIVPKEKLPNYNIFYEGRVFSKGISNKLGYLEDNIPFGDMIFRFPFGTIATEVCEDGWSPDGPARRRCFSGAEIIINISASPWRANILNTRHEMISTRAYDNQATIAYVNQYGGNDSLVFDGGGFINQNGREVLQANRWQEGISSQIVDLDTTNRLRLENNIWREEYAQFQKNNNSIHIAETKFGQNTNHKTYKYPKPQNNNFFIPQEKSFNLQNQYFNDLIQALITGLDGFYSKRGVYEKIGIALSGGKDSALTLIIACLFAKKKFKNLKNKEQKNAIKNFITCFSMPSQFNTKETKNIAKLLCKELGVNFQEISIESDIERELKDVKLMLNTKEKEKLHKTTTAQNIQARIRGEKMQNWANGASAMWLQSGNMSEKAVGYTTVGGDMMGAFSIIGNLPKTVIIALLAHINKSLGLESIKKLLKTKASAELEKEQMDEKDLMPFPVLDACIHLFIEEKMNKEEVYDALISMWSDAELKKIYPDYRPGMLRKWLKKFIKLFPKSIYKWEQSPQSIHLGKLELDRSRALQLPVVQSGEWM